MGDAVPRRRRRAEDPYPDRTTWQRLALATSPHRGAREGVPFEVFGFEPDDTRRRRVGGAGPAAQ
jgi:hypothetical protein